MYIGMYIPTRFGHRSRLSRIHTNALAVFIIQRAAQAAEYKTVIFARVQTPK